METTALELDGIMISRTSLTKDIQSSESTFVRIDRFLDVAGRKSKKQQGANFFKPI